MLIKRLTLTNFRNYPSASLRFEGKFVCITGNNGAGKTNLLDAVHYLGFCRSFRSRTEAHNLLEQADFFRLEGDFSKQTQDYQVVAKYAPGKIKEISCNEEVLEKLSQHIGRFPMVLLSPDDHLLMDGYSEERRKFLDSTIAQLDVHYLEALLRYNQALKQRNAHLKNENHNHQLLDGFDVILAEQGTHIHAKRLAFMADFLPIFNACYHALTEGGEAVKATYESKVDEFGMAAGLKETRRKDVILKRTSFGIHRDEVSFEINGFPARQLGSQGQKKSFLLSLKIAQLRHLHSKTGLRPLLMLDDLFDKLDRHRINALFLLLNEVECDQVFITDTNSARVAEIFEGLGIDFQLIEAESGKIVT